MKKIYPDYLVLLMKNKKLYAIHYDYHIWEYFHNNLRLLEKNKISYVMIDNLEIIKKMKYFNNQYYRYKKMMLVIKVLEKANKC